MAAGLISALPPETDIGERRIDVREVPIFETTKVDTRDWRFQLASIIVALPSQLTGMKSALQGYSPAERFTAVVHAQRTAPAVRWMTHTAATEPIA